MCTEVLYKYLLYEILVVSLGIPFKGLVVHLLVVLVLTSYMPIGIG